MAVGGPGKGCDESPNTGAGVTVSQTLPPGWWVFGPWPSSLRRKERGVGKKRMRRGALPGLAWVGQRPRCLPCSLTGEMELPQCVEDLEDDVFQLEDGEPGTQPGGLLSADLFAQSQLDCPLSRLQFFPLTHCCGPGLRATKQEDKATQTLSPASPSQGVMLPCGVTEEPQRLFYGNAGYRLPLPATFPAGLPLGEQPPEGRWQHRGEVQMARKLRCIADQFHRLHVQRVDLSGPQHPYDTVNDLETVCKRTREFPVIPWEKAKTLRHQNQHTVMI
ncbi:bcl-2-modifying factor isoform X2 [Echinops telfairi]|uniref:Bcl-2-modifying factor isoform X2 n=1 Tax=Echinops telfairi TaxID=9371 RepID=A0AC55CX51_ECHTE|nr:bcl-2-modifying factor isoform X2 [Echinops telfairi]